MTSEAQLPTAVEVTRTKTDLIKAGRFEEAIEYLETCVEADPGNHRARYQLAIEQLRLYRWDQAIDSFEQALESDPANRRALVKLGICHVKTGRFAAAEDAFGRALRVGARHDSVVKRYVAAATKAGHLAEAAELLESIDPQHGDDDVSIALAGVLQRTGRQERARSLLEEVARRAPASIEPRLALAKLDLAQGRADHALTVLEPVARQQRQHLHLQLALVDAYRAVGRLDDAARRVEELLVDRPNSGELWRRCAAAHSAAGNASRAAECEACAEEADARIARATALIEAAHPFHTRWQLLAHALKGRPPAGLVLEFGVGAGSSVRFIGANVSGPVYGFDSFEGLPEESDAWSKGQFAQRRLPDVPPNVELVVGWFEQTLDHFLASHPGPIALLHIDCDLYVSTAYVFEHARHRLVPGSVIVFDELWRYTGWENHEWRALEEHLLDKGFELEFIGRMDVGPQVATRVVTMPPATSLPRPALAQERPAPLAMRARARGSTSRAASPARSGAASRAPRDALRDGRLTDRASRGPGTSM